MDVDDDLMLEAIDVDAGEIARAAYEEEDRSFLAIEERIMVIDELYNSEEVCCGCRWIFDDASVSYFLEVGE